MSGSAIEVGGVFFIAESAHLAQSEFQAVRLSCISDDTQGESLEVLWDAEIGPEILADNGWFSIGHSAPDSASERCAGTRTAAERELLQARSGPVSGSIAISHSAQERRNLAGFC